jgi:hypothetical protein
VDVISTLWNLKRNECNTEQLQDAQLGIMGRAKDFMITSYLGGTLIGQ